MAYDKLGLVFISNLSAPFKNPALRTMVTQYQSDTDTIDDIFADDYFKAAYFGLGGSQTANIGAIKENDIILVKDVSNRKIAFGIIYNDSGVIKLAYASPYTVQVTQTLAGVDTMVVPINGVKAGDSVVATINSNTDPSPSQFLITAEADADGQVTLTIDGLVTGDLTATITVTSA